MAITMKVHANNTSVTEKKAKLQAQLKKYKLYRTSMVLFSLLFCPENCEREAVQKR